MAATIPALFCGSRIRFLSKIAPHLMFQVPGVYVIRYPASFAEVISLFDAPLNFRPPLFPPLECFDFASYSAKLQMLAQLPVLLCADLLLTTYY